MGQQNAIQQKVEGILVLDDQKLKEIPLSPREFHRVRNLQHIARPGDVIEGISFDKDDIPDSLRLEFNGYTVKTFDYSAEFYPLYIDVRTIPFGHLAIVTPSNPYLVGRVHYKDFKDLSWNMNDLYYPHLDAFSRDGLLLSARDFYFEDRKKLSFLNNSQNKLFIVPNEENC